MRFASRVEYRERQRLRAGDLQAEQDYLLGLAGRHHVGPHTWGIVSGLHITTREHLAVVSPGIAIDGYGRELVVGEQVELTLKDSKEQFVYLHYCERPQGGCGGNANSRWRDVAEVFVTEERLPIPETDSDLSIARAAGRLADYPPWPILLGAIALIIEIHAGQGDASRLVLAEADKDYRFVALGAARIVSPSGQTAMRIGQENLADPYHLRISTQDKQGTLQNRFAVDRDGNTTVWGNLVLSGSKRSQAIPSTVEGVSLKVELKSGSGAEVRSHLELVNKKKKEFLRLSVRSMSVSGELIEDELLLDTSKRSVRYLAAKLSEFNNRSNLVQVAQVGKQLAKVEEPSHRPEALSVTHSADDATQPNGQLPPISLPIDDRETVIEYEGAVVEFKPEPQENAIEFCGCQKLREKSLSLPEGFVFESGPATPSAPAKDIYCFRVVRENLPALEELRVVGGAFKKGDLRRRVSIGGSTEASGTYSFQPWLLVRGNGAVELPGGKLDSTTGETFPMIRASGTIELPPITPDPRDPVFNALSVLAFTTGVLARSASLLKLSFTFPTPFIETDQDWSYVLKLENKSTQPLTPSTSSEIITADSSSFLRTIQNIPDVPARTPQTVTVPHLRSDIPIPPGTHELVIDVRIAMKGGGLAVAGQAKVKVPVVLSPAIDLSQVPASIPNPPAVTPADFPVVLTNPSGQPVTITAAQSTGLGTLTVAGLPVTLAPNAIIQASLQIPHQAATGDNTVTIQITYKWFSNSLTLSRSKKVTIT